MVVRWLGAFRKRGTLHESLAHELNRDPSEKVAADPRYRNKRVNHARVGLIVHNRAIRRKFNGDVWSEYFNGTLNRTRAPQEVPESHGEAWVHPVYVAIAVNGKISKKSWKTVQWFSETYNLPIRRLTGEK